MWCTNDNFPSGLSGSHLISASHFRIAYTADDENDQAWDIFYGCLGLIFMPVSIASTKTPRSCNCLNPSVLIWCKKKETFVIVLYLVGAWYVAFWARPAKNGKCRLSNLSSMQSSKMSLSTGVQRDIWYVWSVTRFFRGIWYAFLRFPYWHISSFISISNKSNENTLKLTSVTTLIPK